MLLDTMTVTFSSPPADDSCGNAAVSYANTADACAKMASGMEMAVESACQPVTIFTN